MEMPGPRERLRPLLASCFGLGYSPIMPGTCGALVGPAIYIPLALAVPNEPPQSILIGLALLVWSWITVALGGWAETYYQRKDCQIVVTDEVAGFLLAILLFHDPAQPVLTTLWAFPIVRIFDIVKLPPVRHLEKLPRGWGVLADDLFSSVYTAFALYGLLIGLRYFAEASVIRPYIMGFTF